MPPPEPPEEVDVALVDAAPPPLPAEPPLTRPPDEPVDAEEVAPAAAAFVLAESDALEFDALELEGDVFERESLDWVEADASALCGLASAAGLAADVVALEAASFDAEVALSPALDAAALSEEPLLLLADAAVEDGEADPVELLLFLSRRLERRWAPPLPAPPLAGSVPEVAACAPCLPEADAVCCSS